MPSLSKSLPLIAWLSLLGHDPSIALASPSFPRVIAEDLGLEHPPACTLCHTNPTGGIGTANTPFADFMKTRGLQGGDDASLRVALLASDAESHDTDGDGTPDVEELLRAENPNDAQAAVSPPEFGCRADTSGTLPTSALLWSGALAVVYRRGRGRETPSR